MQLISLFNNQLRDFTGHTSGKSRALLTPSPLRTCLLYTSHGHSVSLIEGGDIKYVAELMDYYVDHGDLLVNSVGSVSYTHLDVYKRQ